MNSYKHLTFVAFAIFVGLGVLLVEPPVFAQAPHITSGVNYLKATQNPNGNWGGTPTTLNGVFPTTAAALEALQTLEATPSPSQTQAIAFLTAQTAEVTPFLAARIPSPLPARLATPPPTSPPFWAARMPTAAGAQPQGLRAMCWIVPWRFWPCTLLMSHIPQS